MSGDEFTEEQKQYLSGFVTGAGAARAALGMPGLVQGASGQVTAPAADIDTLPKGPERFQIEAQNRFLAANKKLVPEEKAKREKPPFSIWDEIVANAEKAVFPKGTDVFLYKFYGLFYVAPAQGSFMSRLRIPGGILKHWQFEGLADLADRFGGGYAHVTTRNNIQIREIGAKDTVGYLQGLFDLGITSRGSGADNIRNVTGSPTAGIDPQELIDTRQLARELQHFILQKPEFFMLPRKFNIAFDGGGLVGVLEETNDIGFQACLVKADQAVPPGVYFRLALGGITGHCDIARDMGVILRPEECIPVAAAILKVFIAEGDRTDRKKARMKYVLDDWGYDKYLAETEKLLGYELTRLSLDAIEQRPPIDRMGHVGIHPQSQDGLCYIGVPLLVGRLEPDQMRHLAEIARRYGDGDIRLTVWQNLILSGIAESDLEMVKDALLDAGLHWSASHLSAGLIACTGAFGCKFAQAHTKETAAEIQAQLDGEFEIDQPVNIHITGCPNSCAQHYIGDIGMLGIKVPDPSGDEDADDLEGFEIYVGGGWGENARIGRKLLGGIQATEAPATIRQLLEGYQNNRDGDESFVDFTTRHDIDTLKTLLGV